MLWSNPFLNKQTDRSKINMNRSCRRGADGQQACCCCCCAEIEIVGQISSCTEVEAFCKGPSTPERQQKTTNTDIYPIRNCLTVKGSVWYMSNPTGGCGSLSFFKAVKRGRFAAISDLHAVLLM